MDFCVAPNEGGCSPPDGSYLNLTKTEGTACNATDQIFLLDQDGVIYHICSGKVVCPQDNNPTNGKKLMLKEEHFKHLSISRQVRLPAHNNLKNLKNDFCVHPHGGMPLERKRLEYSPGCNEERLKLNFFELVYPFKALFVSSIIVLGRGTGFFVLGRGSGFFGLGTGL
ncbi:hypothetical protein AWC38_SpisGene18856 [Stylophora pistillata]|uniref:Uncharacterized protein n=1 Tax=Stylophora pistillata TaxID=50429 RepID=A0A2B4RGV4_STYPI|nr:hypothetical protein AWC38_SpisGene18856 [Stylophora pistillata]